MTTSETRSGLTRWGQPLGELDPGLVERLRSLRMLVFDFDGVMTDNRVYVDENGREHVACSRFEGFGLDRLRALDVQMCIISTEVNPIVMHRAKKLKLPVEHGVKDKLLILERFSGEFGVPLDLAAYMGNDVNDIAALEAAGTAIVVGDAHPAVTGHADYVTERPGGYGAVREVCDLIADIKSGG